MTHTSVVKLSHYCFLLLGAKPSAPMLTHGKLNPFEEISVNFNRNSNIFNLWNMFEKVASEMAAILLWPQYVKHDQQRNTKYENSVVEIILFMCTWLVIMPWGLILFMWLKLHNHSIHT